MIKKLLTKHSTHLFKVLKRTQKNRQGVISLPVFLFRKEDEKEKQERAEMQKPEMG